MKVAEFEENIKKFSAIQNYAPFVTHPELVAEQEKFTKESETRTLLIKLK